MGVSVCGDLYLSYGKYSSLFIFITILLFLVFFLQTLASHLYQAARECSYVDPRKVEEILQVSLIEMTPSVQRPISETVKGELCIHEGPWEI